LISENFPPKPGGSGRWFWELYSRLPKGQYQVLAGIDQTSTGFDQRATLPITRENLSSSEWGVASLKGLRFYFKKFWSIKRYINKNGIKEIHCGRVLPEGVIAYLLNIVTGIPYVCYVHGEDLETAKSSREQYFICGQVIKRAKMIVCNSQNSADIVAEFGEAAKAKSKVMHPGVDKNMFFPASANQQIKDDLGWGKRRVALTVGRLQARKGQDMMIKAVPKIVEQYPDFLYAIVGGGEQKQELISLVADLNLTEHVMFMSEISDEQMVQCYQQCDLFILPNRTINQDIEGFGMVLVEAQSCGKPVIAGDSGGTKETMLDGQTGYVIDATSVSTISAKVCAMLDDDDSLQSMGHAAREHVVNHLDWQALTVQATNLFKN
jgi:phosphatidylinositol alpha-1,6-mannosyltransferase